MSVRRAWRAALTVRCSVLSGPSNAVHSSRLDRRSNRLTGCHHRQILPA